MFGVYTLTANRVHDRVKFTEGNDTVILRVEADPDQLVAGLLEAQKLMKAIQTEEDVPKAAHFFAKVLFGEEQAQRLLDFYYGNPGCVLEMLCRYFASHLNKKIVAAQKRKKRL